MSPGVADPHTLTRRAQRQALLAGMVLAAVAALTILLAVLFRAAAQELDGAKRRAVQFASDVARIGSLRERPRRAAEADLAPDDLLARVSAAMKSAGIAPEVLLSQLPQPPRRVLNSPHIETSNRLVLEGVRLEPVLRFCDALLSANPHLHVASVSLRAGQTTEQWSAEVDVVYWRLIPADR